MKKNQVLYAVVFLILIYSCTSSTHNNLDFSEKSFQINNKLEDGSVYKNENLFIGRPSLIKFHPDSFLIIEDIGTARLIKIIDLKSNKIQELIPLGRGPGEMIVSWGINILGNDVYVFCGQLRKVIILSPDSTRKFNITREFFLNEKQTLRFHTFNTDTLLCLSNIGDKTRLTYLDSNGRIINKLGDYPPFETKENIVGDNDIFFSSIASSPDGKNIVLACAKTDILEIYGASKGLTKRYQGPLGIKLTVNTIKAGTGYMLNLTPKYLTYGNIVANNNEFWVSYNGLKLVRNKRPLTSDTFARQIFCFDWLGNPKRKIEFEFPLIAFDVDWDSGILYSLVLKNDFSTIICYQLDLSN